MTKFFDSHYFFKGRILRYTVTFCSCTGFLLLGYDQGVMGSIVGADNRFGRDFDNPNATVQGLLSSVYDLGCTLGSIIAFMIGEKVGRRKMMMMGGFIMIIGTILLGSSYSRGQFYAGRVITGIGNGFNSSTVPVYQSECAKPSNRGQLLCWQGVVTIVGVVISYWVGYGCSFTDSSVQWRFPISFQAVFAIALFIESFFLPESPRWLVQEGRSVEAVQVLADLTDSQTIDSQEVQELLLDIETAVEMENKDGPFQIKELFMGGEIQNFRRVCLSIFLQFAQQFSGSNGINYFAPKIFTDTMGMTRNIALILSGCAEIVYLAGSFIPLYTIDRVGRRKMLMISSGSLSFCFVMVSILLSIGTKRTGYGATVFIFLYQLFMGIGFLPVPWFYPAEISTTRLRSKTQAIASAFNWLFVFAVVQMTPPAIENIGWKYFVIFAVLCAAFIPVFYCLYPETAGLELEDIDHIFERPGLTRGVFSTKGKTIETGTHARRVGIVAIDEKEKIEEIEDV